MPKYPKSCKYSLESDFNEYTHCPLMNKTRYSTHSTSFRGNNNQQKALKSFLIIDMKYEENIFLNVKDLLWLLLTFCVTLLNHIKTAEKSDQMYFYVHRFGRFLFLFFSFKKNEDSRKHIFCFIFCIYCCDIYSYFSQFSVSFVLFHKTLTVIIHHTSFKAVSQRLMCGSEYEKR